MLQKYSQGTLFTTAPEGAQAAMMNMKNSISQLHSASTTRLVIVITLTYLLLGAFGLMLAISPGYASPIFPASGLALACVLWFKRRALAGIWLGSVLMNITQAWLHGTLTPGTVVVALLIATGAALQAWIGCWLVQRWQGSAWRELKHERDAFMFLLLGGIVSCLVSASFGVTVLYLAGVINQADVLFSWWNWYVGDTLGVLVFTPLAVRLLNPQVGQPGERCRYNVVPILFILGRLHD